MHSHIPKTKARRFRPRRTSGDHLRHAIIELAQGKAIILTHEENAWASVTFSGSRHEVVLDFDGAEAVEAGENFIAALPDHEFAISGHLVADAVINSAHHRMQPAPQLSVNVTILMLVDA